jgi:hypothetical protein
MLLYHVFNFINLTIFFIESAFQLIFIIFLMFIIIYDLVNLLQTIIIIYDLTFY